MRQSATSRSLEAGALSLFSILPRWPRISWGLRYLWYYLRLSTFGTAIIYVALCGFILGLIVTYFTITAFALASLAIPLGVTFAHREKDRLLFAIERDADAMAMEVQVAVAKGKPPPSTAILTYAKRTGGHVIVVDPLSAVRYHRELGPTAHPRPMWRHRS